eukprot:989285-Pyramimonas_sp.AAC.1
MKFKPFERWAWRPTLLRVAVLVKPAVPLPVAIVRHVARRGRLPRCPRDPVAKPLVVLDVAD